MKTGTLCPKCHSNAGALSQAQPMKKAAARRYLSSDTPFTHATPLFSDQYADGYDWLRSPVCQTCAEEYEQQEISTKAQILTGGTGTLITVVILFQQLSTLIGQSKMGIDHLQWLTALQLVAAVAFQVAFALLLVFALRRHINDRRTGQPGCPDDTLDGHILSD